MNRSSGALLFQKVHVRGRSNAGSNKRIGVGYLELDQGTVLAGILVFIGYFLGARLGFALTFQPRPVSVMWPPNAILLAALLLSPPRTWWFLLLSAFPAHLLAELQSLVPLRMVLCWFISNCSEALIGAVGTRLVISSPPRFDEVRTMGAVFLYAGLLAPALSSFLDAAFVSLNHFSSQGYWTVWRMRMCSNLFTDLTVVPAIVTWSSTRVSPPFPARKVLETIACCVGLLIVSIMVFFSQSAGPATSPALLYAPTPFLLWAAVRLGTPWTCSLTFVCAILGIWGAVHGRGPFTSQSPETNALSIQSFFLVVSMMFTLLAISVSERRKSEERLSKTFHSSLDAILISHLEDGRIVEVNERWQNMFGYERRETIGQSVFDLNIYLSNADREKLLWATSGKESLRDLELGLRTKSGELRYVQISSDTEQIGGHPSLITMMRDISDRKRAEQAQESLAHVSRLAVMGELTAMMAHEVNQPLGAILSNAEAAQLLLDSGQSNLDEVRQILADIRKDDLRADGAIRRIRGLLTKRELQMQPLCLNDTISDVLRFVAGDALRRRVHILKQLEPKLPLVLGDRFQLQQVLLNLILNGMDAMSQTPESQRELTLKTKENESDSVQVTVSDCGHGVSTSDKARIFESFFTTKTDGMGLGLSIARSIIAAHQGNLWLDTHSIGGATFHFTLRRAAANRGVPVN